LAEAARERVREAVRDRLGEAVRNAVAQSLSVAEYGAAAHSACNEMK